MDETFRIFVIDDDPLVRDIIRSTLESTCAVISFESAESCQRVLEHTRPNLFLLDVGLPGMDGYAFCRWLKDTPDFKDIPVTFVSSRDTIDARLAGYTAGAEDFIVKPFNREELLGKVKVARQIAAEKTALREQTTLAEQMTDLALVSMEESGVILQFLSKIVASTSAQEIAEGILHVLNSYRLKGAVQTCIGGRSHTLSQEGSNLPLEVSVINHVRSIGRIFEFKNRCVFNFGRITILVNNMPLNDPDFAGRIRDNLAIAAQGADGRLGALDVEEANCRNQQCMGEMLDSVRSKLGRLGELSQRDKVLTSNLMYEMDQELTKSFVNLGLTGGQEDFISELIRRYIDQFVAIFDHGDEQQAMLEGLNQRLAALVGDKA